MPKLLHIFDFDGTIARTPCDTSENRKLFQKETGLPWVISKAEAAHLTKKHGRFIGMRNGWWGRKETLEPPLVPDPAPASLFNQQVCKEFLESKADANIATVIMTGRHRGISNQVLRILGDGGLVKVERKPPKDGKLFIELADPDVQVYFLGDDGPRPKGNKPAVTLEWKIWMLEQFLELYPETETVKFWEDRAEHVHEFQQLQSCLAQTIVVEFVQ